MIYYDKLFVFYFSLSKLPLILSSEYLFLTCIYDTEFYNVNLLCYYFIFFSEVKLSLNFFYKLTFRIELLLLSFILKLDPTGDSSVGLFYLGDYTSKALLYKDLDLFSLILDELAWLLLSSSFILYSIANGYSLFLISKTYLDSNWSKFSLLT